jgi:hypothetical protein
MTASGALLRFKPAMTDGCIRGEADFRRADSNKPDLWVRALGWLGTAFNAAVIHPMPLRRSALVCIAIALMVGSFAPASRAQDKPDFATLARNAGTPQIPGLRIVYLSPLGNPAAAPWQNIILHQTEGPPGSARAMAQRQARNPSLRGVTLWVETDGTVYWATPETAITTHGDGANRNDNKYIDNSKTYRRVTRTNSIGIEFVGNFPDVRNPPTPEQFAAGLALVRFLQERYGIPAGRIYAHNWIDYKDARYCEGCALAERVRAQGYVPRQDARPPPPGKAVAAPASGR